MTNILAEEINIYINLMYIKNTAKVYEGTNFSSQFNPKVKEEDFSWIKNSEDELKQKYMKFPLNKWRDIVKEIDLNKVEYKSSAYQTMANVILEKDIFKNQVFKEEDNIYNLLSLFPEVESKKYNIKPDFIIVNIPKNIFTDIISQREYMLTFDKNFNKFENIEYINIIGESKVNHDRIADKNQKENYLNFIQDMNNKNNGNFFMLMYVFDISYKNFWEKDFFIKQPIIIAYIPQIYNYDRYKIENILSDESNKDQKNRNAKLVSDIINIIIEEFNIIQINNDCEKYQKSKIENEIKNKIAKGENLKEMRKDLKQMINQIEEQKKEKIQYVELARKKLKEKYQDIMNQDELLYKEEKLLSQKRSRIAAIETRLKNRKKNIEKWAKKDSSKKKTLFEIKKRLEEKMKNLDNQEKILQLNEEKRKTELEKINELDKKYKAQRENVSLMEEELKQKELELNNKIKNADKFP